MRRLARLAAATALVAAAGLAGPVPAYADACSTAAGVTVVVDFHELGGGLQQVCDPGGGGQKASSLFPDNGFPLTYVQRQPGFVCRVSGAPADDPCVNTPPPNAYWGLWWSDGESGSWTYSSTGVGSLTIPEGGAVAFSWNGSSTKSPPGAAPPAHEASDEPSPEPSPEPSAEPEPTRDPTTASSQPSRPPTSTDSSSATASASPSATEDRADRARKAERERTQRPGERDPEPAEPTDPPTAVSAEPPAPTDDALPVWVGPTAVGALLGVAGVAAYLRRRAH